MYGLMAEKRERRHADWRIRSLGLVDSAFELCQLSPTFMSFGVIFLLLDVAPQVYPRHIGELGLVESACDAECNWKYFTDRFLFVKAKFIIDIFHSFTNAK